MKILSHEVPQDILYCSKMEFPGFSLLAPRPDTLWNNRSKTFQDILIDTSNENSVVSFGFPKIFNINEACPGRIMPRIDLDYARVYSSNDIVIVSRYNGKTYTRRPHKFPEDNLIDFSQYVKLSRLFESTENIASSIVFCKNFKEWAVMAIIDHFTREVRTPDQTVAWCKSYEVPIMIDSNILKFDILKQAAILYDRRYYIHYGSDMFQIENNWYAHSTCLCNNFNLEKVIECWLKFEPKNFINFKARMLTISSSLAMRNHLVEVLAAYKIYLTVLAIFTNMVKSNKRAKVPQFLQCFYYDIYRERDPKESNVKQAYLQIINLIKSFQPIQKPLDKPLLLSYPVPWEN